MSETSILKLVDQLRTEADAYEYLERMRWNGKPVCPHCGNDERIYFLTPANGVDRKTTRGATSQRRVWKCGACRKQFSVLTGTIFHGTKIPVRTWIFVIFEMCASKNGVAAREIERKYDLSAKSAWFMLHRIREAMKREPLAGLLGGNGNVVVADETAIGGKVGKMNKKARARFEEPKAITPCAPGSGPYAGKSIVLSLIDTETGEARSEVVRDVTASTLRKHIADHVDMAGTVLHADEAKSYKAIAHEFQGHEAVNHSADEYVRYEGKGAERRTITSNQVEGFFSQLKRSLDGTHHAVSSEHLPRYLAEFDYRYSTRKISDTERMARLVGQVGDRRLSYRPLTSGR